MALQQKVDQEVRLRLPDQIVALLETPISGRGEYGVLAGLPTERGAAPVALRTVTLDGELYRAFVYGRREAMTSAKNVWLEGIAVDDVVALKDLEAVEEPQSTQSILGTKRLLLVRVDFSNLEGEPFNMADGTARVAELHQFFSASSYNKLGISLVGSGSAITPTFRMPQPSSAYADFDSHGYALLRQHALNAAAAAGYVLADYDYDVICFNTFPGWNYCGLGYVGAPGAWVNCPTTTVFAHELGHNFGLWHANLWDTAGQSIIGPGESLEYGDPFDTMGSGAAGPYHFNARYKALLNWLTTNDYQTVAVSGTYRIQAHDLATNGLRALRI
ncbi:MAG: M66 family metalloprotease, partial [Limisphaerales bacterium]